MCFDASSAGRETVAGLVGATAGSSGSRRGARRRDDLPDAGSDLTNLVVRVLPLPGARRVRDFRGFARLSGVGLRVHPFSSVETSPTFKPKGESHTPHPPRAPGIQTTRGAKGAESPVPIASVAPHTAGNTSVHGGGRAWAGSSAFKMYRPVIGLDTIER